MIEHALHDRFNATEFVRGFDQLLTELGVDHEYREIDATHCNHPWDEDALKFMSDHLVGEEHS